MSSLSIPVGTIVELSVGRGVVRWSGTLGDKPGKFFGVELYEQLGKNDGSFEGHPFFKCKPNYGLFVRASNIKSQHGLEAPPPGPSRPTIASRPSLGHQRTSSIGAASRSNSLRTASPSSARSTSPSKPTSSTPVRPSRLAQGSPTKKTPSISLQRQSFVQRQSPSLDTSPPNRTTPPRSTASPTQRVTNGTSVQRVSSPFSLAPPSPPSPNFTQPPPRSESPLITTRPPVDDQELQELRAKVRVLEVKRADDARHLRELEARLSDAESFVALRPKLQAKLASLQTEVIAAKREVADAQQMLQLSETRMVDGQEMLEMAMLDKEVAEERAEIAESELEDVRERLAISQVELEVYKDSEELANEEGNASTVGKDSLAYIQLEKQNARLKEALLRLRDMTQETDLEQRRKISELEKDISGVDTLQSQYDTCVIKLTNAEIQIEDLKLQLDDALGAEDMIVQLTEQNLMLKDKIEDMRINIEDLEALKELSDELEENHIETEKNLHEDLDAKDMQIQDQLRRNEVLDEACLDLEGTITQFRDLVMQLQGELDHLRLQTQTAQTESATAASQSAAVMSLNMKLQSSAAKNQARNVELELTRLEARENKELLGIIQPYLPQLYVETDSDATSCYLFFRRLASKADLINSVVAQTHGLPDALNGPGSESLVGVCDLRARLAGLATLCKRFAAIIRKCDVQTFLDKGRIYPEIASMERRLDMHIDLLRRDEFREMECARTIDEIQAQFDHLDEKYFNGFDTELGEREHGFLVAFDFDLDMIAAAIGLTKTSIQSVLKDDDLVMDMAGMNINEELFEPLQKLLDKTRSAKNMSRKLTKRLEDLVNDSAAVKPNMIPQMRSLSNSVQRLVHFAITLAKEITMHCSDVRGAKSTFQLKAILAVVKQATSTTVGMEAKLDASYWEPIEDALGLLVKEASDLLPAIMEPERVMKTSGIVPPWVTRVDEIKAALAVNVEAERKVAQLNDEIQGLVRSLKTKDQTIQESGVKIELIERRMEAVKKQADTIVKLEGELTNSRKQETTYEEAMEQLQADLDRAEQENVRLKSMGGGAGMGMGGANGNAHGHDRDGSGVMVVDPEPVAMEGNLETAHLVEQLEALRGTVRFLRTENSYLKGQDLLKEIESLPPLVVREREYERDMALTPPLDPSGASDTDDDDEVPRPRTVRSLTTETKLLYRDIIAYSASPKVVDLSVMNRLRSEGRGRSSPSVASEGDSGDSVESGGKTRGGKVWVPKKSLPAQQILDRKIEAERLSRRMKGLLERF